MKHIKTYEKKSNEDVELQIIKMIEAFLIFYKSEFTKLGFLRDSEALEMDSFGDDESFIAEIVLTTYSPIYVEWNRKKSKIEIVLYNGERIQNVVIEVYNIFNQFGTKKKSDKYYQKEFMVPIENIPNITKEIELINIANNYNL